MIVDGGSLVVKDDDGNQVVITGAGASGITGSGGGGGSLSTITINDFSISGSFNTSSKITIYNTVQTPGVYCVKTYMISTEPLEATTSQIVFVSYDNANDEYASTTLPTNLVYGVTGAQWFVKISSTGLFYVTPNDSTGSSVDITADFEIVKLV
jgi:hypothetical protein